MASPADHWITHGQTHITHASGYEVAYSRYSVTYRDGGRSLDLGAEFDEDGVLRVQAAKGLDAEVAERIAAALQQLGVKCRMASP